MPTTRMIDPRIWQSNSLAKLTVRQRLLFIGLFSTADDQGRARAHPALVRSSIFPYDEISASEIADDLKAIENAGCIHQYEDNGTPVLQVLGWWAYQHPQWAYPSNIAPMDGWQDRLRYRRGERQIVTVNWEDAPPSRSGKRLANRIPNPLPGAIELELGLEVEVVKPPGADAPSDTPPALPCNARDGLRFDLTPEGKLMALKLQEVYASKGRRPPEFYENSKQRDAYLTVFCALGSKLSNLLDSAMESDITERARLLRWLKGCSRKNGHGPGEGEEMTPAEAAVQKRREREAAQNGH